MIKEIDLESTKDIIDNKDLVITNIKAMLVDKWMDAEWLIIKIKKTIDEAVIVTNSWISYPDTKWITSLLKLVFQLAWMDMWKKMQVNIFNIDPQKKLEY